MVALPFVTLVFSCCTFVQHCLSVNSLDKPREKVGVHCAADINHEAILVNIKIFFCFFKMSACAPVSVSICSTSLLLIPSSIPSFRPPFSTIGTIQGISNQADSKRQEHLRPPRALTKDYETGQLVLMNFSMEAAEAQARGVILYAVANPVIVSMRFHQHFFEILAL